SIIRQRESGGPLRRTFKRLTRQSAPVFRIENAQTLDPGTSYPYDLSAMLTLAEHCSQASRRADKASWDVEAWLKCEYMQDFIDETFTGVVASLTNFGLFIELEDIQVEGLIHISALKDDYYKFDPAQQRMVGERHHRSYGLGDSIEIRVVRVDMDQRKIEFELAQQEEAPKPRKKRYYKKRR
ncbi:MAG: S1 RNA-binding domain-containing protein, partial [Porticoccaceae bacterium]|nr:S1 RNA-binding domain-containing protein [Porticoccaceae bacterium]